MNKIIFATVMPWFFAAVGYKALAQETPKAPQPPREVQEIIIKKKGDKDASFKLEFKDDKVLINGKPLIEFNDDEITINNRTIKYKQLEKDMEGFGHDMERFGQEMELAFGGDNFRGQMNPMMGGTFLGVTTQKDDAGAKIEEITNGSAAEKAGLEKGDIITKIDDKKVEGPADLSEIIRTKKPGEEIKINYKRNGKDKTTKASLQERREVRSFSFSTPRAGAKPFSMPGMPNMPGAAMPPGSFGWRNDGMENNFFSRQKLGLKIQDLEEGSGVKVLEVEEGSAAEKAGVKKDDIITGVAGITVNNTDDAREQLHINSEKSSYPIVVKRNNAEMKFEIKIPKKLKTANL